MRRIMLGMQKFAAYDCGKRGSRWKRDYKSKKDIKYEKNHVWNAKIRCMEFREATGDQLIDQYFIFIIFTAV